MPPSASKKGSRFLGLILLLLALPLLFLSTALALPLIRVYVPSVLRGWPPPTPTPLPGRVVISEVLYDPSGAEPDGEWIELINTGELPYDLTGHKIGDEEEPGQREGMYHFPAQSRIDPRQIIIVAYNAAVFKNQYGFLPDYEIRSTSPQVPDLQKYTRWAVGNMNLVNTGDEVLLLDPMDNIIDVVSWGDSYAGFELPVFTVPEGHSIERFPVDIDRDIRDDWVDQSFPNPGKVVFSTPTPTPTRTPTRTPTPSPTKTPEPISTKEDPESKDTPGPEGTAAKTHTPSPTPTATPTPPLPELLISEVLYSSTRSEPDAEWIEIYNPGDQEVDLSGYLIENTRIGAGVGGVRFRFPEGTVLEPGGVLVIAGKASLFNMTYESKADLEILESLPQVPNLIVAQGSLAGFYLDNNGDGLILSDADGTMLDQLAWGYPEGLMDPPAATVSAGQSLERYPCNRDTDTAADWRLQKNPSPGKLP